MSKYTTEVRYICEQNADLSASQGSTSVDEILDKCWDKIFTTKCKFFDEEYRPILCKKILKHFYLREIGVETVGIWKLWLNTRLSEIMPYYNQMYQSQLLEILPFVDTDYTESQKGINQSERTNNSSDSKIAKGKTTRNNTTTNTSSTNDTSNVTTNNTSKNKYSDTPQGSLTDVENGKYLTNYRNVSDSGTTKNTITNSTESSNIAKEESENSVNETNTTNATEEQNASNENTTTVRGKRGGSSYSTLLQEYRETFLNIDMLVINDFEDLFMLLW